MTAEFGPQDVDLTVMERVAAGTMWFVTAGVDCLSGGTSLRFRRETATLVISGTSEVAGEGYARGMLVALLAAFSVVLPATGVFALGELGQLGGELLMWLLLVPVLLVGMFTAVNAVGAMSLLLKTDVIDHTTDPAPDALDELREAYVAGELDEHELEARTEEVWARE